MVFAGTMYKLRQGDPDVQESESFWEFILVGFYLVIGVGEMPLANVAFPV